MPSETPPPSKSGHENDIQNGAEDAETIETVETPELDDQPEPFPANTSTLPADYSDVPSSDHQDSSKQRRKHQRGGRKKKSEDLQSVSESHLPAEDNEESYEEEERETPQPAKPKLKHRDSKPPFDTGIRAFNLKRAESSGGRPFGISVGDKKSKSKSKTKSKSKASSRRRKQKEREREEEKEHWESDSNEEGTESEEEEEEKPQQQKPFSIRLDLNLELEIFLRAKIKGDVTITFL
jgi:hypothetical protein